MESWVEPWDGLLLDEVGNNPYTNIPELSRNDNVVFIRRTTLRPPDVAAD
jgi:hypothetical protein